LTSQKVTSKKANNWEDDWGEDSKSGSKDADFWEDFGDDEPNKTTNQPQQSKSYQSQGYQQSQQIPNKKIVSTGKMQAMSSAGIDYRKVYIWKICLERLTV
jgi:hypothetical protein